MSSYTELDRLIAIQDILQLKARRDRALDRKDWRGYAELHAPDHESANDGFESWIGRESLVKHASAALDGVATVHHSHTPDISLTSPDAATAIWYLEDQLYWNTNGVEHWARGFGFYHERCERRDGVWLFTYRRLERTLLISSPGAEHPAITGAKAAGVHRVAA